MQRPIAPLRSCSFVHRSRVRALAMAAAMMVAAPAASTYAADEPVEEAETREVIDLELKIAAGGQDVGQIARLVELDTETLLAFDVDGHAHAIDIKVRKADDRGRKLAVTLGYQVDGQPVMKSMTIEAAAKKAKVVRSEGGKVALSLKMAPRVVPVDELPPPPRARLELDDDVNDPLAGL